MLLIEGVFQKTVFIYVVIKFSQSISTLVPRNEKPPLINDEMVKYLKHPSYKKNILLYSKQGYFLSIGDDGKISGTHDGSSADGKPMIIICLIISILSFEWKKNLATRSLFINRKINKLKTRCAIS